MEYYPDNFVDDKGTTFTRCESSAKYDYKLSDSNGIDYCTVEQMLDWKVRIESEL